MTEYRSCFLHGDYRAEDADARHAGMCPACAAERAAHAETRRVAVEAIVGLLAAGRRLMLDVPEAERSAAGAETHSAMRAGQDALATLRGDS